MENITRWQLQTHAVNIVKVGFTVPEINPTFIWERKDKEGKTDWDKLNKLANDGWELVSVTPIVTAHSGQTFQLLYTFKRPLP
ncbi:MAG: DUF4177 domain-containing protein [Chloroflexi bacterium]|nr:DUF4177 domain-containing protein [Chloroflexota bacterium]